MKSNVLYHAGVADVRVPPVSSLVTKSDRKAAINSTGVISVIGLFQVNRMAEALAALAVEHVDFDSPTELRIEPGFCLAQPWDFDAMVSAVRQRRDGGALGPVEAQRIIMADMPTLYRIRRGEHSVFAARQADDPYLKAKIVGELRCDPALFYICDARLMRFSDGGKLRPVWPSKPWSEPDYRQIGVLAPDIVQILQTLGVRIIAAKSGAAPGNDNEKL